MSIYRGRVKIALLIGTAIAVFHVGALHVQAEMIINGGFEINTAATTVFNPLNATFNATMASVTAYGAREGIDIQTVGSGYGVAPQGGSWKVSPASDAGGTAEEFSFDLTGPVNAGTSYDLQFYIERLVSTVFDGGTVEIGVSSSATSFGTLVHTSALATDGWSLESTTFVAPVNANYLTVRVDTLASRWVGLDSFSLKQTIPEPSTLALTAFCLIGMMITARRRLC